MKYLINYKTEEDKFQQQLHGSNVGIPNLTIVRGSRLEASNKYNNINSQPPNLNSDLVTSFEYNGDGKEDVSNIFSGMYNITEKRQILSTEFISNNLPDGFYRCVGWWDMDYDGWFNYKPVLRTETVIDKNGHLMIDNDGQPIMKEVNFFERCVLNDPRYHGAPDVVIIDEEDGTPYTFNAGWCLVLNKSFLYGTPMTFNDPKRCPLFGSYPYSQPMLISEEWNEIFYEGQEIPLKNAVNNYFLEKFGVEFNLDDIEFPNNDTISDNALIKYMNYDYVLFTGFAPPDHSYLV